MQFSKLSEIPDNSDEFSSPKEVVIITIGERIRQKRLEAGMSVDELALKLGTEQLYIVMKMVILKICRQQY